MSTYDEFKAISPQKSENGIKEKKKIMSVGFKRFSLMCIKQFCVMQVTAGICYLAVMGHAQTGFLPIPCWAGSMCSAPVICQHGKDANRFPCNELGGLEH